MNLWLFAFDGNFLVDGWFTGDTSWHSSRDQLTHAWNWGTFILWLMMNACSLPEKELRLVYFERGLELHLQCMILEWRSTVLAGSGCIKRVLKCGILGNKGRFEKCDGSLKRFRSCMEQVSSVVNGAALSVTSSGGAALSVTSSGGAALSVTSSGGAALSVTSDSFGVANVVWN